MLTTFFTSPGSIERYRYGIAGRPRLLPVRHSSSRPRRLLFCVLGPNAGLTVHQLDQDAFCRLRSESAQAEGVVARVLIVRSGRGPKNSKFGSRSVSSFHTRKISI